ncbi:MAG: EAL domain-containing protein, partial [Oscillospiraceae bacterium]
NELLNGSCVFTGVADREVYVHPDLSVFDELNKVQDDADKLLNFVVQKQSSAMSAENSTLMKELLRQQEKEQEQLYTDSNTKIYNGIKYSEDQNTRNFNKICLGQIENAEPLMAAFGHEGYRALLRELAEKMHKEDDRINKAGRCAYYLLNDDIVFLAAEESMSQGEFMDIVNELYGRYHFVKSRNFDATLVFRFVVVLNRENLLGSALATLQKSKSGQSHFMVSDESTPDSPELGNELQMIQILNDVIEQESVIPYFQGIYDNKIKGINQYEALMRIADKNGKIYTPGSFMEIAKKYHLYLALSRLMLTKVFDLFGDRNERVSVNISACDIASDEMVAFLLEKLGALKTADNFVFEILEDENFGDMARLQSFIDKVRPFGVQVAIDDFGTGYSNFMEVIKIDPDYIKIDLGIVRSLDVDPLCRKVMETIIFLGERLHANLVAEGVETAEIQEKIAALAVEYSQGFHFAFPVPFGELGLLES